MGSYILKGSEGLAYPAYYELVPHDSRWSLLVHYGMTMSPAVYGKNGGYSGVIAVMKRAALSIL